VCAAVLVFDRFFLRCPFDARLPHCFPTRRSSDLNAILPTSASGEYCLKMGLPVADLNSYATHRGDHNTALRATLANPKLFNEMRSEEHTSELQSRFDLVCRLLLEKKNTTTVERAS